MSGLDMPPPDPRAAALAGALSGTFAVAATYPLVRTPRSSEACAGDSFGQSISDLCDAFHAKDLIRTRQALDRRVPPRSTLSALRAVLSDEGAAALFRGLRPAVLSHAPAAAIFFTTYTRSQVYVPSSSASARYAASAGVAWTVTCLCMNPMWVVKTRFQAQATGVRVKRGALKYGRVLQTLRVVYAEQGLRGLYSGTMAACAGAPAAALQMPVYEYVKHGGLSRNDGNGELPSPARIAVASAGSAAAVSAVAFPTEVVRLRMQAQEMQGSEAGRQGSGIAQQRYNGVLDAFRTIYKKEGFFAFYRGLSASLVRTVPNSAIGLLTFETLLRAFSSWPFLSQEASVLADSASVPKS